MPHMETELESIQQEEQSDLPDTPNPGQKRMNERLWRLSERSRMDGSTEVPVVDWMPEDYQSDVPYIRYEHPLKEDATCTYKFDMPKGDGEEYELVRFLNDYGLSLSSAQKIEDFTINVRYEDGDVPEWTPDVPEYEPPGPTKKERVKSGVSGIAEGAYNSSALRGFVAVVGCYGSALLWPILAIPVCYTLAKNEDEWVLPLMIGSVISFVIWMITAGLDATTLELLFHFEPGTDGQNLIFHGW